MVMSPSFELFLLGPGVMVGARPAQTLPRAPGTFRAMMVAPEVKRPPNPKQRGGAGAFHWRVLPLLNRSHALAKGPSPTSGPLF